VSEPGFFSSREIGSTWTFFIPASARLVALPEFVEKSCLGIDPTLISFRIVNPQGYSGWTHVPV
jgi:hypothetical protein